MCVTDYNQTKEYVFNLETKMINERKEVKKTMTRVIFLKY